MAGNNETIWELESHTEAKHTLLRVYLNAWIAILGGRRAINQRVIFLDGFAGPGIYKGGEPGSPIIALEAIYNARVDLSTTKFTFLFVENDEARAASLRREVDRFFDDHGKRDNIVVYVETEGFVQVAETILEQLEDDRRQLAPTLAMIDPFGFSNAPMELVRHLLRFEKCEVIFNLMIDSINWHAENDAVVHHMQSLFGTDEFQNVPPAGDPGRQEFLIQLFEDQLRDNVGFTYVSRFNLINKRGRSNVIFHGTRHHLGLEKMRAAFWKLDPISGNRFDAREDPGAQSLVQPDLEKMQRLIMEKFAGQTVTPATVRMFLLRETVFPISFMKTRGLRVIEKSGGITSVEKADGSKRSKGRFPNGCSITFAERANNDI